MNAHHVTSTFSPTVQSVLWLGFWKWTAYAGTAGADGAEGAAPPLDPPPPEGAADTMVTAARRTAKKETMSMRMWKRYRCAYIQTYMRVEAGLTGNSK